jgi:7-cyano-7-deazaguanine synthase
MEDPVAVLSSGGLDSCALLAHMAGFSSVYPIYIRQGLIWEEEEFRALQAFIGALNNDNVQPITTLSLSAQTLYGDHWSVSGIGIPSEKDADSKVYIPGRNVLLLSVGAVWCSQHHIHRIAIGTLRRNPFPDATFDFFYQLGSVLSIGLGFQIGIEATYREKCTKEDLIREFQSLPLELTLSCMMPRDGCHCGQCNKCYERRLGYQAAGVPDRTRYAIPQK